MYIADFNYPSTAYKVWCDTHVEDALPGSVIFTLLKDEYFFDRHKLDFVLELPKGYKIAIYGPEVGFDKDTHPNLFTECSEEIKK